MQLESVALQQAERPAAEHALWVGAHLAHQCERFVIGAEQDVLAIVQRAPGNIHRAGTSARDPAGFEQGHCSACVGTGHRRRDASPAGADDGDARLLAQFSP